MKSRLIRPGARRPLAPLTVALSLCLSGCFLWPTPPPAPPPKPFDPEAQSGPDASRSTATTIQANKPESGSVSYPAGDRSDWRIMNLTGKPGVLSVRITWDNPQALLDLEVFDGAGTLISTEEPPVQTTRIVKVDVPQPTTYYFRVRAHGEKDASPYVIEALWNDGDDLIALPASARPAEPRDPGPKKPRKEKEWNGDGGLQGRIVGSYKEGDATTIYLDKGAAAGVKVGNPGSILEGPSGENALSGGGFTIIKVVDDGRSIGKTSVKTIGRNTRVSIKTGG